MQLTPINWVISCLARDEIPPLCEFVIGPPQRTKKNSGRVPSRKNFQSFFANRGLYRQRPGRQTQEQSNLTPATQVSSQQRIHELLNNQPQFVGG